MLVTIAFNNVQAKLLNSGDSLLNSKMTNIAYKALQYEIPGSEWAARKRGAKGWEAAKPKMGSFFSISTWAFPTGLIALVEDALKAEGIAVKLQDERVLPSRESVASILTEEIAAKSCAGITLRDYQVDAIMSIFKQTRGIIKVATGGGKSEIAAGAMHIAHAFGIKSLFLTHQISLLHQTAKRIRKYTGLDVGIIGDGEMTLGPITVATVETIDAVNRIYKDLMDWQKMRQPVSWLKNRLEWLGKHLALSLTEDGRKIAEEEKSKLEKYYRIATGGPERIVTRRVELRQFLESIGMLFMDEAHRGSGSQFQDAVKACPNAFYRIGLTATPWMKTDLEDLKLMAVTGPIIHETTVDDLVKRGLLAKPYIKFVKIKDPVLPQSWKYPKAYSKGIVENTHRNAAIIKETRQLVAAGNSVLILVTRVEHGKTLLGMMPKDFRVQYIHGEKDSKTRMAALDAVERGELDVLIASTIADEGLDLPSLNAAILAGGGASSIKVYQRIGRSLRPKKDGPNEAYIVDFIDLTQKYLAGHSMARYQAIRSERGYSIVDEFWTAYSGRKESA